MKFYIKIIIYPGYLVLIATLFGSMTFFTTKVHKGIHKGTQRTSNVLQFHGKVTQVNYLLPIIPGHLSRFFEVNELFSVAPSGMSSTVRVALVSAGITASKPTNIVP